MSEPNTIEHFIEWVSREPNLTYDWCNPWTCVIGRYTESIGKSYDDHKLPWQVGGGTREHPKQDYASALARARRFQEAGVLEDA